MKALSLSLYLSLSVFVKCNAISLLVYIYLLLRIRTKFIYTGRLSSWKLCLCPCICLCVCLCLCLCHLQMKPGAVLFPTMYDMLNPTLESWKYWCFIDDRPSVWWRRRKNELSGRHPMGPTTMNVMQAGGVAELDHPPTTSKLESFPTYHDI